MIVNKLKGAQYYIALLSAMMLSGCELTNIGANETPTLLGNAEKITQGPVTQTILPEEGLTPRQRMVKALTNLEHGNAHIAETELIAYMQAVPLSGTAKTLLRQIQINSEDFYPNEFFTLTLHSGQSLSTLAKKYLGTALEFFALAKYNNIANPSRVNIGKTIKIPLTQLAKNVKQKEEMARNETNEMPAVNVQNTSVTSNENIQANALLAEIDALNELSTDELIKLIENANSNENYSQSSELLSALLERNDINGEIKTLAITTMRGYANQLLGSDTAKASELYAQTAQIHQEASEPFEALPLYQKAVDANPNNEQAALALKGLTFQITEKYHREASVLFRQQALDKAIEKWDIVLWADPGHSSAMAYRTQAIELRNRLEALKN